jgi:anti-sigma factor RsiW
MWDRYRDESVITGEDLGAFADGRLPRARAVRVAAHMRAHPEDAGRIHAYWRQEAALYRAFEPVLHETPPREWPDRPPAWRMRRRGYAVVAIAATLVLAVTAIWRWPGAPAPSFAEAAFDSYTQAITGANGGVAPEFPGLDLEPLARRLIRLDNGSEVTEYRYRHGDRRVALYAADAAVSTAGLFRVFERTDTRLVEWISDGRRYALVGKDGASELTRLAVQLRDNLSMSAATLAGTAAGEAGGSGNPLIQVPSHNGVAENRVIPAP